MALLFDACTVKSYVQYKFIMDGYLRVYVYPDATLYWPYPTDLIYQTLIFYPLYQDHIYVSVICFI